MFSVLTAVPEPLTETAFLEKDVLITSRPIEFYTLERVSIYHAVESQTDSKPLVTSSGYVIDTTALNSGGEKILALSRDLLKKFNGNIRFGDVVFFDSQDQALSGEWVVQDTMNSRYCKSADLLMPNRIKGGLWFNLRIYRLNNC
jgi:hypothetical protein